MEAEEVAERGTAKREHLLPGQRLVKLPGLCHDTRGGCIRGDHHAVHRKAARECEWGIDPAILDLPGLCSDEGDCCADPVDACAEWWSIARARESPPQNARPALQLSCYVSTYSATAASAFERITTKFSHKAHRQCLYYRQPELHSAEQEWPGMTPHAKSSTLTIRRLLMVEGLTPASVVTSSTSPTTTDPASTSDGSPSRST